MSKAGPMILVVDDEQAILRSLRTNLTRHGFDVEVAETAREALDIYARRHPELILLDLGLPDMDGMEVIREIRARDATPIVILSVRGA
ncbi:MAG TPA: response regulator, partial [Chloroflexota bacterium]|nr:response regulator [Chloroflexota bacterium]